MVEKQQCVISCSLKPPGENIDSTLQGVGLGKNVLNTSQFSQAVRPTTDKWSFVNMKCFYTAKDKSQQSEEKVHTMGANLCWRINVHNG